MSKFSSDLWLIKQLNDKIIQADNEGNLKKVLSCYTEDVVWLAPNGTFVEGKENISSRYEELYENFTLDIKIKPVKIEIDEVIAFSHGITEGKKINKLNSEETKLYDRYMMSYRKINEDWKVSTMMWNNIDY